MKTTRYFQFVRERPDRACIREDWILRVLRDPQYEERQSDGRIRRWAWIEEEKKYLRVIVLEDGVTVHNAFFDRSVREHRR